MLPLKYSLERVQSVLNEIGRLKDSDFPYPGSRAALDTIEQVFAKCKTALDSLTSKSDPSTVGNMCSESLSLISHYLPLLGFILRSTNVRNSFEVCGPLLRLARQLLGSRTKLILSSEWMLSPHVYSQITELPDYVLLGLPASESGNPLLVSLAGHELGHTAWNSRQLRAHYAPVVEKNISDEVHKGIKKYCEVFGGDPDDLFYRHNVAPAHLWALKQVEETFCDCMGVRLFAEAFLHAFAYLLSPGINAKRSPFYPSAKHRCANLEAAATAYAIELPPRYADWFTDQGPPTSDQKESYLLSLADSASSALSEDVIAKVVTIASEASVPEKSADKISRVLEAFKLLVPASNVESLVNILNAGWLAYHDGDFWQNAPNTPKDKVATLNELILKSIEILEIEELTRKSHDA